MRSPLSTLDERLVPALARGLRRTVDIVRYGPVRAPRPAATATRRERSAAEVDAMARVIRGAARPTPEAVPRSSPVPEPVPVPVSEPISVPTSEPAPEPVEAVDRPLVVLPPEPDVAPAVPEPVFEPRPEPEPTTEPEPAPVAPEPEPGAPEPAPVPPEPEPVAEPAPVAPEPITSEPVPAPIAPAPAPDGPSRLQGLDERYGRRGVLGLVREIPQLGFVAIGALVVAATLSVVVVDSKRSTEPRRTAPGGVAATVPAACPAGTLPAGQTDAFVGPADGASVPTYVAQQHATLAACAQSGDPTLYAVISFDQAKMPADVAAALRGATVLRAYVTIPGGTDTPRVLDLTGADNGAVRVETAIRAAYDTAAGQFEQDAALQTGQAQSITPHNAVEQQGKAAFEAAALADQQQAHQLRAACACSYGAVVLGPVSQLVALQTSDVRVIALAPAGTALTGLTGRPLLPAETTTLSTASAPAPVVAGSLS